MNKIRATKINHITILARDKNRAEKFFTEILGLEKINISNSLWIKVGNQFIHISDNSGESVSNTFYHFAVEYENLLEVVADIIAKGVDVFDFDSKMHQIRTNTELDKENRQFFVRDYDGNLVELVDAKNKFFNPL